MRRANGVAEAVALCIGTGASAGPCSVLTPPQIIQRVRADAIDRGTLANGFLGDPLRPVGPALLGDRYYGPPVWAGGY